MTACATCSGYGNRHDPIAHNWVPEQCWAMADDENPDCPIGSARCVRAEGHGGEHIWEARL
jgi:hypothetical protein